VEDERVIDVVRRLRYREMADPPDHSREEQAR
jgi:hypothetical protein